MFGSAKFKNKFSAAFTALLVVVGSLSGALPAFAATFVPTSAETNVAGTQILVHHSVALDAARSTATTADYTIRVGGVARATNTYTLGYSSNDVVLTLTSSPIVYGNVVTVSYNAGGGRKTYQAGGGNNTLAAYTNLAVTNRLPVPDTTAPVFTAMTTNTAGTSISITYNEPLLTSSVPAATDFNITQTAVQIPAATYTVGVSGSTVTITFNSAVITYNTVVNLSYTPGTNPIKDLAGNSAVAVPTNRVTNTVPDTTAPRVLSRSTNTAGTIATIYFDEQLSTSTVPLASDFNLQINNVSYPSANITVAVTDSRVDLTLTGTPILFGDNVTVSYTRNTDTTKQIKDLAGNPGNSTNDQIVTNNTLDLGAPTLVSRQTNTTGDQITLTYSYPLDTASVPLASAYTLTVGGSAYTAFTAAVSGSTVVLSLIGSPITFGASVSLSYSGTAVKRLSNSVSAATFANLTVDNLVVSTAPPTASNGETSTDGRYIYINMSKPLNESSIPLPADFKVDFDAVQFSGTYTVAISGSQITLHLSSAATDHTYVEVSYTPGLVGNRLKDLAGNEALAWIDLDVTNRVADATPPSVISRVTNLAGTQLIATFSEQLCETCLPNTSDLYIAVDGTRYDPANYTMSITGAVYTFTLNGAPITFGQTVRLTYTPNSDPTKRVQDLAGNFLPAVTNAIFTNAVPSTGAPAVTSKSTNPAGTEVTVAYDRTLDGTSVPTASEFVLKVNGVTYSSSNYTVSISGSSVVLTLTGAAISAGATVTLSYTGSSIKALTGGAAAPTFADNAVSSVVRPELLTLATDNTNGRTIFLTYNVPLNAGSVPAASDFVLTVNGVVYSNANYTVSVTGSSVILALLLTGNAIKQTDQVRLVYNPGAAPIEDQSGNDAAALPMTVVSNLVPDTTAPENLSLATNLIGSQIIWTYNEPLAPSRVPLPTDLVITVDGVVYSNANYTVGVDDSRMVVYLTGNRIRYGQAVLLAYTPGITGNQLADPAGNVVQDEPHGTVLNQVSSTAVPTVSSMATNASGTQVTVTYNKPLSASFVPAAGDFLLTLNDLAYSTANYTVSISGSSVSLNLTGASIANGARVDLFYTAGNVKLQDTDGNYADSFGKTRVSNLVPDTTPPTVVSRVTNSSGTAILITFTEAMNESALPAASDIALVFDGVRYDPSNYTMSISGSIFTFTLNGPAIRYGQVLRLSYTRDLSNPAHWVQDLAGNLVPNSVSQGIDNVVPDTAVPALVSAGTSILGDKINLLYNFALNTGSVPTSNDFTLSVGGTNYPRGNYSLSISGSTVTITLNAEPIAHDETVILTYTGNQIRRTNGVIAATFSSLNITNLVPDSTAPVVLLRDEITIYAGSTAVTTPTVDEYSVWSEALDEADLFNIDTATGAITASTSAAVGVYSYTITATNDAGLQTDATISITVRPVPIVVSDGGDRTSSAPLPPIASVDAPVTAVTSSIAETKVVATVQTGLGNRVVSVLEPAGAVPAGTKIAIKPGPVSDESVDGRFTIEILVTAPDGTNVTQFNRVFELTLGQFVAGHLPSHSSDGKTWPTIPRLKDNWLPVGMADGYYVDAMGNLVVLTRHMTYFGLKKDQELVHDLRIITGPTRTVVGGEFNFKLQGGMGAGQTLVDNHTPEICRIIDSDTVLAIKAGVCQIHTTKLGDGVYANAESDNVQLLVEDPSAKMHVYGSIKLLRVDLGTIYAGKVVSIFMSTPANHPFKLYRKVTLDEEGVKEIRAAFDSHATFKVMLGKKIIVNGDEND